MVCEHSSLYYTINISIRQHAHRTNFGLTSSCSFTLREYLYGKYPPTMNECLNRWEWHVIYNESMRLSILFRWLKFASGMSVDPSEGGGGFAHFMTRCTLTFLHIPHP